jgi:glc operon protein GlcG
MKVKLLIGLLLFSLAAIAQNTTPVKSPSPMPYGEPINLETAKKIIDAARSFSMNNQWPVAIAIVDTGGNLVLFEKIDNTQVGSIEVAIGKAKTANNFKRSTKTFEDAVAGGGIGLRVLAIPNVFPLEGGEPIIVNGKIIGAIGVSGMKSTEDAEVVKAGLAVLK